MRKPAYILLTLLFFVSSASANPAYLNWNKGPVEIENQFPLAIIHSSFRPMSPEVLDQGASSVKAGLILSNTYIHEKGEYTIDAEYRSTTVQHNSAESSVTS